MTDSLPQPITDGLVPTILALNNAHAEPRPPMLFTPLSTLRKSVERPSKGLQDCPIPRSCPLNRGTGQMSLTIERAVEATPEMHDLIGELNEVLGAAYEAHQRHGLSIEELFEPNLRFFLARLDGLVVG